ncbi:PEP-CTERM sorting domain-containing protein [Massilia sp. CCM 8734]|uniref:PEP-CTERM sorting domain-containing protein n=1 Tax=Massilia sp. CCM 8734 TaxID=2609283 RepID=UPI00142383AB|nr:PEP-CTERM sorting domain-containing protein [Massilia sp. CCM 8734]NHZ99236.1 PEP-CTERM sorting domain-containing protein [Massilia sp. CCM 8734]
MHPHFNKRTLCALAALVAAWAPAQANTSTSSASIEQFQFRLVDLDLNDGIAPSITFGTDSRFVRSEGDGQVDTRSESGSTSIVTQFGSAGGTLSDTALLSHTSVDHLALHDSYHTYGSQSNRATEFILSPNTELIFTGVGRIAQHLGVPFVWAEARISMSAHLLDANGSWTHQFNKSYDVNASDGWATINLYGSLISDAQQRRGEFSLDAFTVLAEPVSTVPEPSTYAMLLAGTFMLGAVARRRKAAAARAA